MRETSLHRPSIPYHQCQSNQSTPQPLIVVAAMVHLIKTLVSSGSLVGKWLDQNVLQVRLNTLAFLVGMEYFYVFSILIRFFRLDGA